MRVGSPGSDSASPSVVSTHPGLRSTSSVAGTSCLGPTDKGQGVPGGFHDVLRMPFWCGGRLAVLTLSVHSAPWLDRLTPLFTSCSPLSQGEDRVVSEKRASLPFRLLSLRLFLDLRHRLASAVGMDNLPFPECLSCLIVHCDRGEVPLNPSWLRALILNALELYVDFYLLGCFCKPWGKGWVS